MEINNPIPAAQMAERYVKWRERRVVPKAERPPKSDYDTTLALAHIAASWAAYGGFATEVYYDLQHPRLENEQRDVN